MGSVIYYNEWDGGSGIDNRRYLIGYCKEEPIEVLKALLYTHDIYRYQCLYRPIDNRCPCNVSGLLIHKSNAPTGCVISSSLSDLDLSDAKTKLIRTKESILESLELCRKWHTYEYNKKLQKECWSIIDSVIKIVE